MEELKSGINLFINDLTVVVLQYRDALPSWATKPGLIYPVEHTHKKNNTPSSFLSSLLSGLIGTFEIKKVISVT